MQDFGEAVTARQAGEVHRSQDLMSAAGGEAAVLDAALNTHPALHDSPENAAEAFEREQLARFAS
jgi:hypothetical protein